MILDLKYYNIYYSKKKLKKSINKAKDLKKLFKRAKLRQQQHKDEVTLTHTNFILLWWPLFDKKKESIK